MDDANALLPKFNCQVIAILFFFFGSLCQLHATTGYAQNTKIDLDKTGATILEIIDAIEAKTEFKFFYSKEDLDLQRKVDMRVKGINIEKVLQKLFPFGNVNFKIIDKQIVLTSNTTYRSAGKTSVPPILQDPIEISGIVTDSNGGP